MKSETKSYGEMLAEQVCGVKRYSTAELAAAARRDAGIPATEPVRVTVPNGSDELKDFAAEAVRQHREKPNRNDSNWEYQRHLNAARIAGSGFRLLPGGIIQLPN